MRSRVDWHYPWLWGADLKSFYKSLWLGWWLLTWCAPDGWPEEVALSFQPGT